MRRLMILRHAKAVVKAGSSDFDRALAPRGREQMREAAGWLAASEPKPDLALVSPAARTRETWALAGLDSVPVRFERAIYEAEIAALLKLLHAVDAQAATLLLVGHNPGLEDLAIGCLGPSDAGGSAGELRRGLPTAGLAVIEFPQAADWPAVKLGTGRLVSFRAPNA